MSCAYIYFTGNNGKQFRGAFHLHTETPMKAENIFDQLYTVNKDSVASLLSADLVVFYCTQGSARSPAAMASYLRLKTKLSKPYKDSKGAIVKSNPSKIAQKQKVVLLDGGLDGWLGLSENRRLTDLQKRGESSRNEWDPGTLSRKY